MRRGIWRRLAKSPNGWICCAHRPAQVCDGVLRAAVGQHVDELEVGEREDDREQGDNQDDRSQQRQSDEAKPMPSTGTIDCSRVVEFGRHCLKPGEQRNSVEWEPTPRIDHDDGDHRERRIAEPGWARFRPAQHYQ